MMGQSTPMCMLERVAHRHPGLLQFAAGRFWRHGLRVSDIAAYAGVSMNDERLGALQNLLGWRMTQGIYKLDEDVEREIFQPIENTPWESLRLPEPVVYVETRGTTPMACGYSAFFASMAGQSLVITAVSDDPDPGPYGRYLCSIEIKRSDETIQASLLRHGGEALLQGYDVFFKCAVSSLLLFSQAVPDVSNLQGEPLPEGPRRPTRTRKDGTQYIGLPKRPIMYMLGNSLGSKIRDARALAERSGLTLSTHTRIGHWHHYWVGPKSDPENRRLEPRWVSPTIVNRTAPGDVPWEPRERLVTP